MTREGATVSAIQRLSAALSPVRIGRFRRRRVSALLGIVVLLLVQGCSGDETAQLSGDSADVSAATEIPSYTPRFGRQRPVIAVLGFNPATELTDYVVPYGVLVESGVGEVVAVAPSAEPIQMSPALRFGGHTTLEEFDRRFPEGADYVIVPNIYEGEDDQTVLAWLGEQASSGATIVGICDGVPTVANAGLLAGRRATTHWRTIGRMREEHPDVQWTRNQRYIADGKVITTTGVSASIPISLALVEAIGGRATAERIGAELGISDWGPSHDSSEFSLEARDVATALTNQVAWWRHEELGVPLTPGVDEVRLALVADTYGRTRRSSVAGFARNSEPVGTLRGLTVYPDRTSGSPDRMLSLYAEEPALQALEYSLADIDQHYGDATADFVALTMEYSWD